MYISDQAMKKDKEKEEEKSQPHHIPLPDIEPTTRLTPFI